MAADTEFILDSEYDDIPCYAYSLVRTRAIQTGEFQLALSPVTVSWLHELEYLLSVDKCCRMEDWFEAQFIDSFCKADSILD